MSNILLGATGSVAVYKSVDLLRQLKKCGHQVKVILTPAAKELIAPVLFSSLGANGVYCDLFATRQEDTHIPLAKWTELFVIAPLTANTLSKLALGIADNLLTTVFLAVTGKPVIVAPAMHSQMWASSAIQENVSRLKKAGVIFVGPVQGDLASGDKGVGRMSEVVDIVEKVKEILKR